MMKKSDVIYAKHAGHKDNFNVDFCGGSLFSGNKTVVAITKEIAKSTENTRALLEHRTMCGTDRNEAIADSKQRTRVLRWQLAARNEALSTEDAARAEDHSAEATTYYNIPDFTAEELAVDSDGDITDQLD
jgi:hypothetical protein